MVKRNRNVRSSKKPVLVLPSSYPNPLSFEKYKKGAVSFVSLYVCSLNVLLM